MKRGSWFRNLLLNIVDSCIEGIAFILIIVVFIGAGYLFKTGETNFALLTLFGGIITVALVSWLFFCIIDVRDALNDIAINTTEMCNVKPVIQEVVLPDFSKINQEKNSVSAAEEQTDIETNVPLNEFFEPAADEKECPYCGAIIKSVALKCRYCNRWLDGREENKGA